MAFITLAEKVAFGSSPNMYLSFYYEKQRSGTSMQYRTRTVISSLTGSSYYGYYINQKLSMDGTQKEDTQLKANSPSQWSSPIEYISPWYTISNKTSGTTSVSFYMHTGGGRTATYNYNMAVDVEELSITSFYVSADTETSLDASWQTSSNIQTLEYSIDNGAWQTYSSSLNTSSGYFYISGLEMNTRYYVRIRVTSSNGVQKTSQQDYATTYTTPYAKSLPNFTVGELLRIPLYNPVGRTVKVYLMPTNGEDIIVTTSSSSYASGFNDSDSVSKLYQAGYGKNSNTYKVKVICDSLNSTWESSTNGTYTIIGSPPEFSDFSYIDSNPNSVAVTGSNQVIVKDISKLKVIISSENKMIPKDDATGARYEVTCGGKTQTANYSEDNVEIELGEVNISGETSLIVKAIDSRGFSTSVVKTINILNYNKIAQNNRLYRLDDFGEETKLKIEGTFSLIEIDGVSKNNVDSVKYRYKEQGGEYLENYTTLVPTIDGTNYSCPLQTFYLDSQKAYEFEILVKDIFGWSTPNKLILDEGTPIMYWNADKRNIGIGLVNEKEEYSLEVKNNVYVDNNLQVNGNEIKFGSQTLFEKENNTIKVGDWLSVYPVGSIYMSVLNNDPSTLFGGVWEQIEDTFLLACGSTYSVGSSGGQEKHTHATRGHTLTVSEMPKHKHLIYQDVRGDGGRYAIATNYANSGGSVIQNLAPASGMVSNLEPDSGDNAKGLVNADYAGNSRSHTHGDTEEASNMPPYLAVYVWKRVS